MIIPEDTGTDRHRDMISLVECPRDAMQGWKHFIPTDKKVAYLNSLLKVGFDTLDFGSFVSAKAIPQMADTKLVVPQLNLEDSTTKLLAIVANIRGAEEALAYEKINCLGFPFSISPTFQQRNTNSTIQESLKTVEAIQNLCIQHEKELVVYLSMGFGNPYGDVYNEGLVLQWMEIMDALEIKTISIADTVGIASPNQVKNIMQTIIPAYPGLQIGVHLHSGAANWRVKCKAAVLAGCRRFDGALKGIGGCPMAKDELVGNMNTELMIPYFRELDMLPILNEKALQESIQMAEEIFQ